MNRIIGLTHNYLPQNGSLLCGAMEMNTIYIKVYGDQKTFLIGNK